MNPIRIAQRHSAAAQRAARDRAASADRTQERLRMGAADRNSPDAVKLQTDLGWKMTDKAAEEYRKNRSAADSQYKDFSGQLLSASRQVDSAEKAALLNIDKEWKKAESGFVDVRVWNKQTLEHVYRLPKEVVDTLEKESFNKGDGSFTANWAGGGYNVDVHPRGTNDAYGKELHTMLGDAALQVKTEFYKAASPAIAKNNTSVRDQAATARGQIGSARGQLEGAMALRKDQEAFAVANQKQLEAAGALQLSGLNLNRGA